MFLKILDFITVYKCKIFQINNVYIIIDYNGSSPIGPRSQS